MGQLLSQLLQLNYRGQNQLQTICRGDRSPYLGMFAQIQRVLLLIADVLSVFSTCFQAISSTYCDIVGPGSCRGHRSQQLTAPHGSMKWHFQPHTPGFGMKKITLINILKNRNSENHLFLKCPCRTCRNASILFPWPRLSKTHISVDFSLKGLNQGACASITGFKPCCLAGQVFGGELMT